MEIYYVLLAVILLNGLLLGKRRKWFVVSSFFLMTLLSALRSTNVGIDLGVHYAEYFQMIVQSDWNTFPQLSAFTGYDLGYMAFCKLLGYISTDPQWYIFATSVIIYGCVALYIYKYSDDVVLETFLFYTSFLYFMDMNIIAQAIALGIFMLAIPYLIKKNYIKYIGMILLSTAIHGSAAILILLIPLSLLRVNRNNILRFTGVMILIIIVFDRVFSGIVSMFFSQFSVYLDSSNIHGVGQPFSPYTVCQLMIYVISLLLARGTLYYRGKSIESVPEKLLKRRKGNILIVPQINSNFLVYMTICSIVFRLLSTQIYVVSRVGYYTYFFGLTLMVRSASSLHGKKKFCVKLALYIMFVLFFTYFGATAGKLSYGVVPYEFFWK